MTKKHKFFGIKLFLLILLFVFVAIMLVLVIPLGIAYVFMELYPDVDSYLMIDVVWNWSVCVILLLLAVVLIVLKHKYIISYLTLALVAILVAVGGWWAYQDIKIGPQTVEIRDAVVEKNRSGLHLTGLLHGEKISLRIQVDAKKQLTRGDEFEYIVVECYVNKGEIIKVMDRKRKNWDIQDVQDMLSDLWDS